MAERKAKGTVATHRNAADRSILTTTTDPVSVFNRGNELLQKEIAVAHRSIRGIDIETASAFRSNDQKIADLMLLAKVIEQRPSATIEEGLLVVAEAVKKVKHGIALRRLLGCACVITGGQIDAVVNRMVENFAVQCVAIDPALRTGWKGTNRSRQQNNNLRTKTHFFQFTRSARPARDPVGLRVPPGKGLPRDLQQKKRLWQNLPATTARTKNAPAEKIDA